MRRFAIAALAGMVFGVVAATSALAHEGGHRGGCDEFGQLNGAIATDPASFGFPEARNLGDIVSAFARDDDGQPGVGDIVEQVDHAACGQ